MYGYRELTPAEQEAVVHQRRERGFPVHAPPHPIRDQVYYLLTAACYEHRDYMQEQARRRAVYEALRDQAAARNILLRAWVVLPNHYHVLAEVADFDVLSDFFRHVHGRASRRWNREDGVPGRKVWYRYSDRVIRSVRHYAVTVNYIHYNPVKHGWAASPFDWGESSIHWYAAYYGREGVEAHWRKYPLRGYGRGWDD